MLNRSPVGIRKYRGKGGEGMKRLTTYHDSEGLHTLWAIASGEYKLENHATSELRNAERAEALAIIHRHGYNRRVYVPSLSERWERPVKMREIEPGVFSWEGI